MFMHGNTVPQETCKYLATDLEDEHQVGFASHIITVLYTFHGYLPPTLAHIQLLQALASALGVYYNSSGQVQCLNTSITANFIGQRGWNFQVHYPPSTHTHTEPMCYDKLLLSQACTRMVMPTCSDGVHDMFFDNPVSDTRTPPPTHTPAE